MIVSRVPRLVLFAALLLPTMLLPTISAAQTDPPRPYHDGAVWSISFIKIKAGFDRRYTSWVANEWKKEQEALKKGNFILDYKVIQTESHSPGDWDMLLMVQFKDLASMEANQDKAEALAMQALSVDDAKVLEGYKDRASWREVFGNRIGREIILEPK